MIVEIEREKAEEESDLIRSANAARETAASFVDVIRILNERICDLQTQVLSMDERLSNHEKKAENR